MGTEFLSGAMKMSWNEMVVMVAQCCEWTKKITESKKKKNHWILHFEMVNFMFYTFYLNLKNMYIEQDPNFVGEK